MISYPYVEDYLEVIAGKKALPGASKLSMSTMFGWHFSPIINLARYDNSFLDSVTDATLNGTALTDRQAELATKLILKYTRQLAGQGIAVENVSPPKYRRALRIIDRTRSVVLEGGSINIRFPYDTKIIEQIKLAAKEGQGRTMFDRDSKAWKVALTEYNVNWVYAFAKANEFEIAPEIASFMDRIIECEKTNYKIELHETDTGFAISNASTSLIAYIEEHLGGFGQENLLKLVDCSQVCGFTVEDGLLGKLQDEVGAKNVLLAMHREYDLHNVLNENVVERIVDYANLTQRWPIVVFNPTPEDTLPEWEKYFAPEEILVRKHGKREVNIESHTRLIYTHSSVRTLDKLPLLVSHVGMLIGTDKQIMKSKAEKIFYSAMKLSS
jgi:hypothetical protein